MTLAELQYVVGNIIRSERYGAISSRIGKIKNTIVAVVFSDCELFSNLELTQDVYDQLKPENKAELPFPLDDTAVEQAVVSSIDSLIPGIFSQKPVILTGEVLQQDFRELPHSIMSKKSW